MKYLKPFNENSEDFPRVMTNQNDIEDWVKWTHSNTADKKEKKLTMDFLDHYFYSKEIKDEEKKMTE